MNPEETVQNKMKEFPEEWIEKALRELNVTNYVEALNELKDIIDESRTLFTTTEALEYAIIIDEIKNRLDKIALMPRTGKKEIDAELQDLEKYLEQIFLEVGIDENEKSKVLRRVRENIGRIIAYFVLRLSDNSCYIVNQ